MLLSSCETVPKFSQEQSMSKPPEQSDPSRGATLQQPDLPEAEIPTRRTPRVVMPTQHPSAQEKTDGGIANPSAAQTDETPTQRIRRIKTPTQQPSTPEEADERAADAAADDAEKVDPAPDRSEDAATVEMPPLLAAVSCGRDSAADSE